MADQQTTDETEPQSGASNEQAHLPFGGRALLTPEPESLRLADLPRPAVGDGAVLVETTKTLVSPGTELSFLHGGFPELRERFGTQTPMGYIALGRVVKVGDDVKAFAVGDRVVTGTNHAEYGVARPDAQWYQQVVPVPDRVSDLEALFLPPAQIAMVALRRGNVEWGESAVVFGQGLIGHVATRLAHFAGARPVIAVNRSRPRLDLLPNLPGLETVCSGEDGWQDAVRAHNDGDPVDVVIEAAGNPEAIPAPFDVLKRGGRCVVASSPTGTTEFDFRRNGSGQSVDIYGAHVTATPTGASGDKWPLDRHADAYMRLSGEPELDELESLVDTYPAEQAIDAFEDVEDRAIGGVTAALNWE